MAQTMYSRALTSQVVSPTDASSHTVVNYQHLQDFQNDTVRCIHDLTEHINHLHKKLNAVHVATRFADWVIEVHPSLVEDYKISERVIRRITDDDAQPEQCESAS